jgi:predicted pyridoxine 5'-phosphate oxidase superfamily flavin-nucleotide-binding protein
MGGSTTGRSAPGFHEGEIQVQQRAGVRAEAQQLVRMLDPAELNRGAAGFLAERTFSALTARDQDSTLWTSPLTGAAGFLRVTGPRHLHLASVPAPGDPLYELPAGQHVGLVAIEFATRRRFRTNGYLTASSGSGLSVDVEQAYGNCPKYIQQRELTPVGREPDLPSPTEADGRTVRDRLGVEDLAQVHAADTFFLGTTHPARGVDASHRGGPAGFVRIEDDRTLWWPDYPGNNMFNSLGNLAVDPAAALLFVDFITGRTLHLSGHARLELTESGTAGDDGHTGRRVRFRLDAATIGPGLLHRATQTTPYPRNPPLTA